MEEEPRYAFNASLALFTAALFSFSCVWLLVVFWIFAYAGNVLSLRVFIAYLLGALAPGLYAVIGFQIAGNEHLLPAYVQNSVELLAVDFHYSLPEIIYLIFTCFLVLVSFVDFMLVRSQENIKPRKEFSFIISLFASSLVLITLSVPDSNALLWLSIVFGSFLLGRFFSLKNNRFTKIVLSVYSVSSLLLLFFN
jgi:hypothetical protein